MLLFKKILMFFSFVSVLSLSAEMLRLDMAGTEALDFENGPGVAIRHCEWLPQPERCLTFNQKATDRWQEIQFTIIPRKTCDFHYYLLAEPTGSWVLVDDVKVNGESVPNGSFERVSQFGPEHWWCQGKYVRAITTAAEAADGNVSARVSHDARLEQKLQLEAGKRYTFSLKFKVPGPVHDIPVDLSGFANRTLADDVALDGKGGWTDQGPEQDLRNFVPEQKYEEIAFQLASPNKAGNSVLVFDSSFVPTGLKQVIREFSEPYPKAKYLYLLHTSAWGGLGENVSGVTVRITLADGKVVTWELNGKREIADWTSIQSLPNGKIVWSGRQPNGAPASLYLSAVPLSNTASGVKKIEFISHGKCAWILLGATLSYREVDFSLPADRKFTADDQWKPTDLSDLWIKENTALDFSRLVPDLPAGHFGKPMIGKDGNLVFEKAPGQPVRLLGDFGGILSVNLLRWTDRPAEEKKRMIDEFARQHKMHGYNFFRMGALMDLGATHSSTEYMARGPMSKEQIDDLDYIAYAFKKHGVYLYLDLGCDNLRWHDGPHESIMKAGALIGESECFGHWRENAEAILNHVNPYTGIAWKDDPMMICTHQFNEQATNAIIQLEQWNNLPGKIKAVYLDRWRQWMRDHYTSADRIRDWGLGNVRNDFSDLKIPSFYTGKIGAEFSRFFMDACTRHEAACNEVIRDTGSDILVSAYNSCVNLGAMAARWQHSEVISNNLHIGHPAGYGTATPAVPQTSSVLQSTEGSGFCYSNRVRALDRPMILSEYSHAFWNKTRYEAGLLTPAYAALNGYTGIVWFAYGVSQKARIGTGSWKPVLDPFSMAWSPVSRASAALSFFLFRRGDVRMAPHSVELAIPNSYLSEHASMATSSVQSRLALLTRYGTSFPELPRCSRVPAAEPTIRIAPDSASSVNSGLYFSTTGSSVDAKFDLHGFVEEMKKRGILPAENITDPSRGIYQSETGEIVSYGKDDLITVTTPRTEAVAGPGKIPRKLKSLSVLSSVACCASASSLDTEVLENSRRILLLYITREANSNMVTSGDELNMRNFGGAPILLETGKLDVSLKNVFGKKMKCYALAYSGERREEIPVTVRDGKLSIRIDTAKLANGPTPFFELVAE